MERKDSIRRFLREQFRDDKKSKDKEHKNKESKESKENKENIANATSSTATTTTSSSVAASTESIKAPATEVKSKSSAYRLFRTVSICLMFTKHTTHAFTFLTVWFRKWLFFGLPLLLVK